MDGQQYLNQISQSNRPVKAVSGKGGILHSKFFIVGVIGVVLLIIVAIIGSVLGGNKGGEQNLSYKLKLHLDGTAELVQEYQKYIKSSDLRSDSASLYGILSNTSRELTTYLVEKYNFKEKSISKEMQAEADSEKTNLNNELFDARINGVLDRIFAHKMAYEITLITNEETKLVKASKNEALTNSLNDSQQSLNVLYDKFNNFSETRN